MALVSSRLKKKFEDWVASNIAPLKSLGLTPNALTLIGLFTSFAASYCYISWKVNALMLPVAGALVLISGLLDAVDGVLARSTGKVSAFGGFLDSISDRYSDAVVLSALILGSLCQPAWGLAAIVGSLMVSYARARAEASGVEMAAVGLAERAERMLLLAIATFAAIFRLELLGWGVALLAVLAHLTVLQRVSHFYGEAKKR